MNLGSHSYTPGGKAPIEILLLVFLLFKYEYRWHIYSAAGQPILSRAVFLIRETPSLSNVFIPLVYFFHVMYMLTAVVPDLSEKGEWEDGKGEPCLPHSLCRKGSPLRVFCLLTQTEDLVASF